MAEKSANLKGTFVRALKKSVGSIRGLVEELATRTGGEARRLKRENERLRSELEELREDDRDMRKKMEEMRRRKQKEGDFASTLGPKKL